MARVTKAKTARKSIRKSLLLPKVIMAQEVDYIKTAKQSNIKALQYAFRDRKNRKRSLETYGSPELMLLLENLEFLIQNLLIYSKIKK